MSLSSESRSHTAMKVIDRTGPKPRELSSYEEIYDRPLHPEEKLPETSAVYMPELLHNIERLVLKTEEAILRNDRTLRYNEDLLVNLSHEREGLEEEVDIEERQIKTLSDILEAVTLCETRLSAGRGGFSLGECEELMTRLKDKYPEEYKVYELSSLAVAVAFPQIKAVLETWDLAGDPEKPVPVFARWRHLLRETETSSTAIPSSDSMDPYDRLVWDVWMPKFRHFLSSLSLLEFSAVIDLLEMWMPLLPTWQMENILEQMVLPRLQHGVQNWDPTTDTVPLHTWVHPWLPLMERKLELLYPTIRHKLAIALNNWHPSDLSAHKILEPWVQVFSKETMEAFVVRHILPKLAYCIQTMAINPHSQDISPFEWVMTWRDMLPAHQYASMLDQNLFPRWMQVLSSWLSNSPNYNEVTKWYSGWKSMLDPGLLNEPSIKRRLGQALDMMNHAVSGTFVPGVRENMAYFTSNERRSTAVGSEAVGRQRVSALQNAISAPVSVSFKDIIEKLAEEHGILFMPVPGQKRYEGKALYHFGRATVYLDRGVAFVSRGDRWAPTSLDELVQLAII
ncbi:Tuftelin-interacting protein 11 [Geodia barretti]|nr:Tuftelin-interacting protein 11 [Geodia barretti]